MAVNWNVEAGRVLRVPPDGDGPPSSSLVTAFDDQDVSAADAIVLRGYLGRSDIVQRARDYLGLAKRQRIAQMEDAAQAEGVSSYTSKEIAAFIDEKAENAADAQSIVTKAKDLGVDEAKADDLGESDAVKAIAEINSLIAQLNAVTEKVKEHIPWRLYLTPRLDRYVDFHRTSLLAWRREPKTERRDACTVWLRVFERGAQVPIPYRLVSEATLVPSFATWINGQFVDDHGDESAFGGAWGDQAISGSYKTGPHCSNRTGPRCMG